ncbi:MAG TPA: O-antigen ligase family protein [Blastocatellia bacterium]|nr:O-antigen ligase family protein [Blastocatellia bacterium]
MSDSQTGAKSAAANGKDTLSRIIRAGLLLTVVFTALAHGAVEPWSVFVYESITLLVLLVWATKIILDKRFEINVPKIALPIVALLAIGLAQSVALTDVEGRWLSLSKNVEATRGAVTVLAFLLVSFLMAANFFQTRERLKGLASFLVIYGLAMALFALVQHISWNGKFYWLRPNTVSATPFGPFVNHNHFAGYMEMLIPVPIAMILTRAVRGEMRLLAGFAAVVMGIAAIASLSRGGMISLAAELVFITLICLRLARTNKASERGAARARTPFAASQVAAVVVIAAVILVGVFWIGADAVINRVTQGQSTATQTETFHSSRGWVWRDTWTMIKANPLLGVGLGAYGTAFSIYSASDGSLRVPQAHNDYLQVVADCGVPGGLIALWFIVTLFRAFRRGVYSRDPMIAALALGSGAGAFGLLVHSVFDFNLQLPSNALLFLLLTAVASNVAALASKESPSGILPAVRREGREEVAASIARGVSS